MKCFKTWIHTEWYLAVCTNASCAFLYYFGARHLLQVSPKTS